MKLFQQLLVAPAALGLLAPLAANAAEVNINDVASYATPEEQLTTAQFSDVVPGDWAYTALVNISESYSCADSAYTQSLKGGQALTRFEAAALINACLDGSIASADVSADADRLAREFGTEMAILKGNAEGLEQNASEFNAGQFSSSTSVSGEVNFLVGARSHENFSGSCSDSCPEALHSKYSYEVNTSTSFTGQDALIATFDAGNTTSGELLQTDSAVTSSSAVQISSLYYTRPFGDFLFAGGPLFDMDSLVPTTTSTYSNEGFFNSRWLGPNAKSLHDLGGYPGLALAYTAENGLNGGISAISVGGSTATQGIFTDEGADMVTLSVGYDGSNYGGGVIYTLYDNPDAIIKQSVSGFTDTPTFIGFGGYYTASDDLDISFGVDFIDIGINNYVTISAWSLGLDWEVGPGTLSGGMAVEPGWDSNGQEDQIGHGYELYYSYPVTDGITVKPMIYITSHDSRYIDHNIYAVETEFKF